VYNKWITTSLIIKAISGNKKDISFCFMINPANNAMAITGEKPDRDNSGPKKYLQAVASAANNKVNAINFPLIFMSVI
jgi:hypothetical protein